MAKIISRASWRAAPPRSVSRTIWTTPRLWVHHSTGGAPANDLGAEAQWMRNIQRFHQGSQRGWSDIGYGFVIMPSGRIYEGRGANVWAAHAPGRNNEPSVCLAGDYSVLPPTDAAHRAVWELADHLGLTMLRGHRQATPTSCPGNRGMEKVVNAPRPTSPSEDPEPLPHGGTLRLVVNGRAWAGWGQAANPLINISRKGLKPTADCAIAWKGGIWRGPRDVTNVAKNLVRTHLN